MTNQASWVDNFKLLYLLWVVYQTSSMFSSMLVILLKDFHDRPLCSDASSGATNIQNTGLLTLAHITPEHRPAIGTKMMWQLSALLLYSVQRSKLSRSSCMSAARPSTQHDESSQKLKTRFRCVRRARRFLTASTDCSSGNTPARSMRSMIS